MNPVLDHLCQRFGAQDCAHASLMDLMAMIFAAALAGLLVAWLCGRLLVSE